MKLEVLRNAILLRQSNDSKELTKQNNVARQELIKEKRYLANEKSLFSAKIKLSREIFAWAQEFRQTWEYKTLQKIAAKEATQSFVLEKDELQIYAAGRWGHKRERYPGTGQWSRVYITKGGTFAYVPGYKWHGAKDKLDFDTPQELAKGISYDYLSALHKSVCLTNETIEFLVRGLKRN